MKDIIKNFRYQLNKRNLSIALALILFLSAVVLAAFIFPAIQKRFQEKQKPVPSVSIGCDRVLWKDTELELVASTQNINAPHFNWTVDGKVAGDGQKLSKKFEVGEHHIVLDVFFDNKTLTARQTTIVIDSAEGVSLRGSQASKNQGGFQTTYNGKDSGVEGVSISVDGETPSEVNTCGFLSTKPLMAGDHTWIAGYQGKTIASGTFNIKEAGEIRINRIDVAKSYNAGDTVNGKIIIMNTGSIPVRDFDIRTLVVNNNYAWMGDKAKREYYDRYSSDMKPGEVYEVPITVTIPEKVGGIRPSGKYSITVSLILNNQAVDTKIVNTEVR
ncbi:MAG TPA: hypothetical protein VIO58_03750 [Candidatus Methanoperedens sp.]